MSIVTAPSATGLTSTVYTVELAHVKLDFVPFTTTKSLTVTPVTGSLNVAVTVKGAFVGFEAGVESTTVGAAPS